MTEASRNTSLANTVLTVGVATVLGYAGALVTKWDKIPQKSAVIFISFLAAFRLKIAFDDATYFRSRVRVTKYASFGVLVGVVTYVLWAVIPLCISRPDQTFVYVLAMLTVELSTIWIALTGLDVEEQLRDARRDDKEVVPIYCKVRRFYWDQPWWIITNCLYISLTGALLLLEKQTSSARYFIGSALWLILALEVFNLNPLKRLIGSGNADPVKCKHCSADLGDTSSYDKYCPMCGQPAITTAAANRIAAAVKAATPPGSAQSPPDAATPDTNNPH